MPEVQELALLKVPTHHSVLFFNPVLALMLSVSVVLGRTQCGCPCCSFQTARLKKFVNCDDRNDEHKGAANVC